MQLRLTLAGAIALTLVGALARIDKRFAHAVRAPRYNELMPLFEYACKDCDHEFEALVRGSDAPECPSCHGHKLQRRLSVFAAHTNGNGSSAAASAIGACGSCGDPRGPGSCSIN